MNWGWKITAVYVLFAGSMIGLVVMASSQRVDLVSQDYYKQELHFSDQIEATRNAQGLDEPVDVQSKEGELVIQMPKSIPAGTAVELYWYCPFNALHDRHTTMSVTPDDLMRWDVRDTPSGMYELRLQWTVGDQKFYHQIQLQH